MLARDSVKDGPHPILVILLVFLFWPAWGLWRIQVPAGSIPGLSASGDI